MSYDDNTYATDPKTGLMLTRRELLKGAAALGAGAMLSPLAAGIAQAATPKRGGHFRIALEHGNTTDSYDPATWDNGFVQCFAYSRDAYLTEIAPDNSLSASLAESWEATPDAKTWTFKLVEGATFHDGSPVTAADVIASLNYHRGEDSKSAAKPIVAPITEMRADGDSVVAITLEAGNADFPFVLSDYHLVIRKAKDGKIDPNSPIGAGSYRVKSFEPGVRAVLERRDDHWKSGVAHFDTAEILSIVDGAARQNALLTGEVDAIDSVDLNTVHLMKRRPDVTVLPVTGTQHYTFVMDCRAEPFNDVNVRLALKHAIDREELVEKILNGYGSVGNDHPIGLSNRYHAAELEQRSYDPDKAKHYLKKAGMSSLDVSLSAADAAFSGAVDAGVLFAEKAAKAGINLNVVREPNDGYWSNVWMKKPFSAVYWGGRPTEDWMFSTAYQSGVAWNDAFWSNAEFDKLLAMARSELDEAKRREMYVEMQRLVRDDGGTIIPMFAAYVGAHSNKVTHGENVAANWSMDGWRVIERWWFA